MKHSSLSVCKCNLSPAPTQSRSVLLYQICKAADVKPNSSRGARPASSVEWVGRRRWKRGIGSKAPQSSHIVSINILPIPKRHLPQRTLDLEAKFLIQRHRRRVVGVDLELQAHQVEPPVGQVHRRLHQRAANALALPVIAHRHAKLARVAAARMAHVGKET